MIRDKLTGALNREYFEQVYESLLAKYDKADNTLGLAILDIDRFKDVNDQFGHDVGDATLKHFVDTIEKYSRDDDILIRWGGEEFLLLFEVNDEKDLTKALEHLRQVVELEKFPEVGHKTCSIGGSLYVYGEEVESTIKRADKALYKAKNAGRNKVLVV